MAADLGMNSDCASAELQYLSGQQPSSAAYPGPGGAKKLSEIGELVIARTTSVTDPFTPGYPYQNQWYSKKENKGKKEPPKQKL
jgi:hypothetical protein